MESQSKSFTITLSANLHRRFKAKAAMDDETMQARIARMIESDVKGFLEDA